MVYLLNPHDLASLPDSMAALLSLDWHKQASRNKQTGPYSTCPGSSSSRWPRWAILGRRIITWGVTRLPIQG
jgi:hypothetical protein